MKKLLLTATVLQLFLVTISAQIITTNPALPTDAGQTTITFDASLGNQGLKDFTGDVYAYTGVTTNLGAWQHVIAGWTVNDARTKMTYKGNNKFELVLSPSIRTFYGVPANETITKLDFVFKNADQSKTGRNDGNADIFYDVYPAGLAVSITNPANQPYFTDAGAVFNLQVEASQATQVKVLIDNVQQYSTASNSFSYPVTAAVSGSHWIRVDATDGTNTVKDSIYYVIHSNSPVLALPAGVHD